MPFFIISIVLQVALVVHIVKTGRNTTWIWIVMILPVAGSIAYIIIEVLPGLLSSRPAQDAKQKANRAMNPNKELKVAAKRLSRTDTIDHSISLADELVQKNMYDNAVKLYQKCLSGAYEFDPHIMNKLAFAQFEGAFFEESKATLDTLIKNNPEYKSASAHLLYARCLAELDQTEEAIHEYEALNEYFPGPEANYRFALMLINLNRSDEARIYLERILDTVEQSAPHYSSMHSGWIRKAKNLLKACS